MSEASTLETPNTLMTTEHTLPGAPPMELRGSSVFDDPSLHYVRVEKAGDEPPAVPGIVDVAVLDMHHGFPNLGHFSIVDTLLGMGRDERALMGPGAPEFRVVSFDVRGGLAVPASAARYTVVVGTGGPGDIDPRRNDGIAEFSQGVAEDPSWEAPLFRFFDGAHRNENLALLAICHSFGLLCRWSGMAEPVLRGPEKGGKSHGPVSNVLTEEARTHPWFSGYFEASHDAVVEVLDSRLFDLVPTGSRAARVLAHESNGMPGSPGEALTMMEVARDLDGRHPRMWGVNHHPEIGDRGLQRLRLDRLSAHGGVSAAWIEERREALAAWNHSAHTVRGLQTTTEHPFERPLRLHVRRALTAAMRTPTQARRSLPDDPLSITRPGDNATPL